MNSRYAYEKPLPVSRLVNMIANSILCMSELFKLCKTKQEWHAILEQVLCHENSPQYCKLSLERTFYICSYDFNPLIIP